MASAAGDSVGYFLEDQEFHGRTDRTVASYERVLRRFERYLDRERGVPPRQAERRDCLRWVHSLRGEVAESTVATYASYLHRFYAYMTQVGEFDENPMALVMEELDESIEKNPTRRDISVDEMRSFVHDIRHPLDRAVIVTLLKTGLRAGELSNLDLRDVSLDHDGAMETFGLGERGQLDGKPDTLYVATGISIGDVVNGERRDAANKRKRVTLIPVDDELKHVLLRWLAIRPDAESSAEPLFLNVRDAWGHRLTPSMIARIVTGYARDRGWYERGGDSAENVTPHYFRHFFTTHLRDRTGDRGIVKYLRGDVADDIIDTYTHNWGDRVRITYESSIYRLLD